MSADSLQTPVAGDMLGWRRCGNRQKVGVSEMASKFGAEIHRRLADHQPTDFVALQVGLKPRVIRWHKAGNCRCPVDGLEVQPVALDRPVVAALAVPTLEELAALPWEGKIRFAFTAGMNEEEIAYESGLAVLVVETVIDDETRIEATRRYDVTIDRMREMFPAKWLAYKNGERQRELLDAARTSIGPEKMAEFLAAIIGHQRTLLIVSEFPGFLEWLRELTVFRYPALAQVLEAAIEVEARALGQTLELDRTELP